VGRHTACEYSRPRVPAGGDGRPDYLRAGGDQGLCAWRVATTGFAPEERIYYEGLRKKGVILATTFPSGAQVEGDSRSAESTLPPVIGVKHLLPTKARILMMLALTRQQRPSEIQRIFNAY
jgi:hypothetical protein